MTHDRRNEPTAEHIADSASADSASGRPDTDRTIGLAVEHLCAGYGKHSVLSDVSFRAEPGTLTGLLGANGCGKTTLLRALCQQLAHSGTCLYDGLPLETLSARNLARRISYIPQRSGITLSLSVLDVVLMGFNSRLRLLENPSREHKKQAFEALSLLGMEAYADADYQKLSEGQKQLCILARTIVEDAPLLLLDEPESSLDFAHRHHMMRLLSSLVRTSVPEPLSACDSRPESGTNASAKATDALESGANASAKTMDALDAPAFSRHSRTPKTALVTLHDPALALEYCQQLVLLKDRVCTAVLHPATDDPAFMEEALSAIYGPIRLYDLGENGTRRLAVLCF